MNARLRTLDPLVIFLVLGAVLYGVHAGTRSDEPERSDLRIVVTDADVGWILESFQRRRFRPPTEPELRALVDLHVKDEILYREAVTLGFDREDPALRRRIATKLEYLAKDVGAALEPTEAELRAHLDANPERYGVEPRRRFTQIYLSADRRGEKADADAKALLAALRGDPEQDVTQLGDPFLLEQQHPPSTPDEVKRLFGDEFAKGLFAVEVGSWSGPVRSGYGLHVVRVHEEVPGRAPPLAEVRARVRDDLLRVRKDEALRTYVDALLEKYDVVIRSTILASEESAR